MEDLVSSLSSDFSLKQAAASSSGMFFFTVKSLSWFLFRDMELRSCCVNNTYFCIWFEGDVFFGRGRG